MIAAMHGMSCRAGANALAGLACLIATAAIAQTAPPPPADPPAVIVAPPAPAEGQPAPPARLPTPQETFGAIGRFIDQSITSVGAGVRGAGETLGATTNAAGEIAKGVGDAAGTVARLPAANIVTGHQLCAAAPNGAPDCGGASIALCKSKGFERGSSLDITSAFKCPAQVLREGRAPNPQECHDESFVSRAVCQ
jgi:hypothetical protein